MRDRTSPEAVRDSPGRINGATRIPWSQRLLHRFAYRLTHTTKLPKGDVTALMRNLGMRGFYPAHVVDIGANRGRWTQATRKVFPAACFTLVEPQAAMAPALDALCARARNVQWINAGAAAVDGEMLFTLSGATSSTFAMTPEGAREAGHKQVPVRVMTLNTLCRELVKGIPDIVKMDAEGFEFEIMKGATEVIGKVELFILELPLFGQRRGALSLAEGVTKMAEYGYVPYDFGKFQRRPYDRAVGQCDVVFARRNGTLRAYEKWR
jgi:FkbM family methyltransferase